MSQTSVSSCTLSLSEEERTELLELLEQSLKESRVEEHRTRTLGYRELVEHRRVVLERLAERLRQPAPAG